MTAAFYYEPDAYRVAKGRPMGRHFAGAGFITAYGRHSQTDRFIGVVKRRDIGLDFVDLMQGIQPQKQAFFIPYSQIEKLKGVGCIHWPALPSAEQAFIRHMHGPRSWSICGVNHTLSSAGAMDSVTSWLTAPFQPWDAVICTSQASKDVIQRLLGAQAEFLRHRLKAQRFPTPQLPVIPLGVDCDAMQAERASRDKARASLKIQPDETVILFLGRLSFHSKAHPAPMYLALEEIAKKHKVVLVECGWTANEAIEKALQNAREALCPSVRSLILDGRQADLRTLAWGAADIFCSLSDNIQETFGLTPIEAMAAGLPVVVSDWDGYKETVRDGVDGFRVPTLSALPGMGESLALRHGLQVDNYDAYIAQACAATVVDIDATAAALTKLIEDPELRARMGAEGARRARQAFDWRVIVRSYERLWEELRAMRMSAQTAPTEPEAGAWPARPDPFQLFSAFPTALIGKADKVSRRPGVETRHVVERIGLQLAMAEHLHGISKEMIMDVWAGVSSHPQSLETLVTAWGENAAVRVRALLLLAKLGLVVIEKGSRPA